MQEQVKELAAAGFPVSQGTRGPAREGEFDAIQFGSDIWLSRWSNNVFRNYPILSKCLGARWLYECCHGMPAFVVGVGPSLDESIKDLKDAKGRAVIVGTDAALRALLANDIIPDLVLSYDCKDNQKQLWQDIGTPPPIPGLLNSCTHPSTIASWPGPILFFNQYHTQDDLCHRILPDVLPHLGQIPSAGTVGTMAVLAAHLMGCDPICAVGMDFCYRATLNEGVEWRYRAKDYYCIAEGWPGVPPHWEPTEIKSLYDNKERVDRSRIVKGEDGAEFRTDSELTHYLDSFKSLMPHFKVPLVNCSPDGMIPTSVIQKTIDGIDMQYAYEKRTVSEAIGKYCKKVYQGGSTILPHLVKIAPDPRQTA